MLKGSHVGMFTRLHVHTLARLKSQFSGYFLSIQHTKPNKEA